MPPPLTTLPPIDIARSHEALLADELREVAFESREHKLGVMGRTGPGAWMNSAYLAFACGPDRVTPDAIEEIASFFEELGIEPRIEVPSYTPNATVRAFEDAGFRFGGFEHVLAKPLREAAPIETPADIELTWVDTDDSERLDRVVRLAHEAFTDGGEASDDHLEVSRRLAKSPGVGCLVAERNGEPVGVSLLEVRADLACLAFGATLKPYRRRGVQRAMMLARLRKAAELGCAMATVGGIPGEGTERNAVRLGFTPCYTRLSFTRPGEGLTPSR